MNKQQWQLVILWLLLATSCWPIRAQTEPNAEQLQLPRPRGRIRIADIQMAKPAPPAIPGQGPISWPNYEPIGTGQLAVPIQPSSTIHTHIPLLREPQAEQSSDIQVMPGEASVQASVVYGNWKPEHPAKPLEHETAQPKQRVYGRLEALLMGLPAEPLDGSYTSSEAQLTVQEEHTASSGYVNPYTQRGSFERSQESRGRWRTPTTQAAVQPPFQPQIEVVRMNASDPLLQQVAKQINESIETTTVRKQQPLQTTEDNWMPLPYPYPTQSQESTQPVSGVSPKVRRTQTSTVAPSPVESTTFALSWPTDFLDATSSSTERTYTNPGHSIDRIDENVSDDDENDDYKYYEDSLNSAQLHNELSVPENLIPQLPLNITRVGIPYEARNSAEEPTICVPLTVTETASESTTPLLVEIERIYCFPLPKVQIRQANVRQQPLPTEPEHTTSDSATSAATEQPQQPVETAGAARPMTLALLWVICSSIVAHL